MRASFEMNRMAWMFMFLFLLTLIAMTVVIYVEVQRAQGITEWCESVACALCFGEVR